MNPLSLHWKIYQSPQHADKEEAATSIDSVRPSGGTADREHTERGQARLHAQTHLMLCFHFALVLIEVWHDAAGCSPCGAEASPDLAKQQ